MAFKKRLNSGEHCVMNNSIANCCFMNSPKLGVVDVKFNIIAVPIAMFFQLFMKTYYIILQREPKFLDIFLSFFATSKREPCVKKRDWRTNIIKIKFMTNGTHETFTEVPIVYAVEKFYASLYNEFRNLPKKDRFTIGQKSETLTLDFLTILFRAQGKRKKKRVEELYEADTTLKILKTVIRLAFEVRVIEEGKYIRLDKTLVEIGRMLGGWIKYTANENLAH
ncbi:MAG: hypothetical protein C3F02_02600 [Parcubacteria group bacterium]|nr:MAG: hypothetical protein C3F02_02600 [Parcubacteria group bacterium]